MRGTTPSADSPRELGVYVHFPYCLRKCGYCDFLSVARERDSIPHGAYADALLAELEHRAAGLGAPEAALSVPTVYFGGGTPSLWEPRELGRVLGDLTARLALEAGAEVTVECNPTSFDRERADALLEAGVNRVSIGVQGLDPNRLEFLERLHDPAGALAALHAALAAGVPRISADLIFGLPGQTAREAVDEARQLAALPITHLSAYALTIEPGTSFGARARAGRLPLAREEVVAESFDAVSAALEAEGFVHYEVSSFARDGHWSRHNLGYWRGRDYLGLGCGAWGTVTVGGERVRYRNAIVPERYLDGWSAHSRSTAAKSAADLSPIGVVDPDAAPYANSRSTAAKSAAALTRVGAVDPDAAPCAFAAPWPGAASEIERIDAETAFRERLMLGLRLADGFEVLRAAAELGVTPFPPTRRAALERAIAQGRAVLEGERLRIPREAWLLADGTIASLL